MGLRLFFCESLGAFLLELLFQSGLGANYDIRQASAGTDVDLVQYMGCQIVRVSSGIIQSQMSLFHLLLTDRPELVCLILPPSTSLLFASLIPIPLSDRRAALVFGRSLRSPSFVSHI